MEYIEGISLDNPGRRKGAVADQGIGGSETDRSRVAAAHNQGITHRDLKPLNVMLRAGAPLARRR